LNSALMLLTCCQRGLDRPMVLHAAEEGRDMVAKAGCPTSDQPSRDEGPYP
jgi:hypothetical protein